MRINFSKLYSTGGMGHTPDTHPHANEQQASTPVQTPIAGGSPTAVHPPRRTSRGVWGALCIPLRVRVAGRKTPIKIDMPVFEGDAQEVGNFRMKFMEDGWTQRKGEGAAKTLAFLFYKRAPTLAPALVADIDAMTTLLDAGASNKQVSGANKQFDAIYVWVFGNTRFAENKNAAYMRAFSRELNRQIALHRDRNIQFSAQASGRAAEEPEARKLTPAELETIHRKFTFAESLDKVQVQAEQRVVYEENAPEVSNPQYQYASTSSSPSASKWKGVQDKMRTALESNPLGKDLINTAEMLSGVTKDLTGKSAGPASSSKAGPVWAKYGNLIPNVGGGDCLFHALAGTNLSLDAILVLRERISNIKRNDGSSEGMNLNAYQLVEGLLQTPEFRSSAIKMMDGRHAIPNDVYANFQAIPGMYAGEDELSQWIELEENRNKTVVVIDEDGTYAMFRNRERTSIPADQLDHHVEAADIVLYKTPQHWEQIRKRAQ